LTRDRPDRSLRSAARPCVRHPRDAQVGLVAHALIAASRRPEFAVPSGQALACCAVLRSGLRLRYAT